MPTEFVRAKDPGTGHEVTVTRAFAEGYKLDILDDKDAVDANGRPLAGKPKINLEKVDPEAKTEPTVEELAAAEAAKAQTAGSGRQSGGNR